MNRIRNILLFLAIAGSGVVRGDDDQEIAVRWAGQLGASSFAEREQAGEELLRLGSRARPVVAPLLESNDPEIRLRARKIWERLVWYVVPNAEADIDAFRAELNVGTAAQAVPRKPVVFADDFGRNDFVQPWRRSRPQISAAWRRFITRHKAESIPLLFVIQQNPKTRVLVEDGVRVLLQVVSASAIQKRLQAQPIHEQDQFVDMVLALKADSLQQVDALQRVVLMRLVGRNRDVINLGRSGWLRTRDREVDAFLVETAAAIRAGKLQNEFWAAAGAELDRAGHVNSQCMLMTYYAKVGVLLNQPEQVSGILRHELLQSAEPALLEALVAVLSQLELHGEIRVLLRESGTAALTYLQMYSDNKTKQIDQLTEEQWEYLCNLINSEKDCFRLAEMLERHTEELFAARTWLLMFEFDPPDSLYDANAAFRLAAWHDDRGEFSKAADFYESGLTASEKSGGSITGTSATTIREKIDELRTLALNDSDGYQALAHRARVALHKQRYAEAIEMLEQAIVLRPENAELYVSLFVACKYGSYYDRLVDYAERLDGVEPATDSEMFEFMDHYRELMALNQALALVEKLMAMDLDKTAMYLSRAAIYLRMGKYAEADMDLETATMNGAEVFETCQFKAFLEFYRADYEAAVPAFECNFETDQENPYYRMWLYFARLYAGIDDRESLAAYYRGMGAGDTSSIWAEQLIGYLLGYVDRESLLKAGVAQGDDNLTSGQMCEAWFYMGLLDRQRGDLAAARAAFEKCMGYRIYIFYEHSWADAELKKLTAEEAK